MAKQDGSKHKDRAHAVLSASGADRWLNCAGSIKLAEKAPVPAESEYAKEGTTAHECLEFLLRNRAKLKAAVGVAAKKYPSDMVRHCQAAAEYIIERAAGLDIYDFLIESKVDLSFVGPDMFGTLDVALCQAFGRLIVMDFKYGAGIAVDPEENAQLLYYALGIAHKYDFSFDAVELVVIQPRAWHESGESVRSWLTDVETLKKWEWIFRDGAKATKDKNAKLAAGKWCKFCPAGSICPELSTNALKQAQAVFSDDFTIESLPVPAEQTVPSLSNMLAAADKLEDWIAKVREHAHGVLERGGAVPGYKLVQKRATRKWANELEVELQAKERYGILAFHDPKILSPAQLEQKIRKLYKAPGDHLAWLNKNVVQESSGLTMVPESDKRDAVNSVAKAFAAPVPALPEKKVSKLAAKKAIT